RAVADRGDIAEAGGGDRDHREIDHVEETDMAIMVIDQPGAVEPVDHHHDEDQADRCSKMYAQIGPDRHLDRPAQRLETTGRLPVKLHRPPRLPKPDHSAKRSASVPIEAWWVRSSCSGVTETYPSFSASTSVP